MALLGASVKEATKHVLSREKHIQVIIGLIEGNTIRRVERMTHVHRDTIMRLLLRVGQKCQEILDE